jgi:PAS domain S-box-containing protein
VAGFSFLLRARSARSVMLVNDIRKAINAGGPADDEGAVLDDGLGYWRARLLDAAWAVLLLGGAVTVVPGLVRAWVDRDVGYVAWVLGSFTLVAVVLRRNVPYTPKAVALVGMAYAAGAIQLWQSGVVGPGPIWLFGTPILAATLLGIAPSIAALAIVAATLITLGPAAIERLPDAVHGVRKLEILGDFLFLDAGLTMFVGVLLQGLTRTVERNRQVNAERSRLARAVDQAADVVVTFNDDGVIEYANASLGRLVGRLDSEFRGSTLPALGVNAADGRSFATIYEALCAGETWSGSLTGERAEGGRWYAQGSFSPLRDASGAGHHLAVLRDVTRESLLEAQLREAQKLEAIGTLAAGIAHDFNNLLVPILGSAELLQAELPPQAAAQLDDIIESARRARGLVSQILGATRGMDVQRSALDLHAVVLRVDRILRAARPANVALEYQLGPVGAVLLSDAEAGQILLNLCTNAFHAMQPQGGRLVVSLDEVEIDQQPDARIMTAPLDAACTYVRLTVTDTGAGMNAQTLSRIFEPFYSTKAHGTDTGLGLAIVHGIASSAGGAVAADSELGRGTGIAVFLPRLVHPASSAPDVLDEEPVGAGQAILVVDDEPAVRRVTARFLERFGYHVVEAASAGEARVKLAEGTYDLLITDQNMPDGPGIELGRDAGALYPGLRMLLCSGLIESDVQRDMQAAGFRGVINKPFDRSELARAVHAALAS